MNVTYAPSGNGFDLFVNGRFVRYFRSLFHLQNHVWEKYDVDPELEEP